MASLPQTPMSERLRLDYRWSARQRQVLDLIALGKTNGEIANELGISLDGAKWHVSEILSKLQAESREEAAEYWRRYNGLAPRFARVFRALASGGAAKLALGGAAVVAAGVGAVVIALAFNDDSTDDGETLLAPSATPVGSSPTPVGSPTTDPMFTWQSVSPGPCPLPDLLPCETATQLAEALRTRSVDAVLEFGLPLTVVCVDGGQDPCGPTGQVRDVYGSGKSGGSAGLIDEDDLAKFLELSLSEATEVDVASVGCISDTQLADQERCSQFSLAFALRGANGDQVVRFAFRQTDPGTPRFYAVLNWVPWAPELRSGEPTPAAYGLSPEMYVVPMISFIPWTPD